MTKFSMIISDATMGTKKNVTLKATGFKVQGGSLPRLRDLGVTEFIVGRAIYDTKDPVQAVIDLSKEING